MGVVQARVGLLVRKREGAVAARQDGPEPDGPWPVIDLTSSAVRAAKSLGGTRVVRWQDHEVRVMLHEPTNHG